MNDEIKEILDKAKEISKYGADGKQHTRFFNQFEAKSLLDYITNLQQKYEEADYDRHKLFEENERLKEDKAYAIGYIKNNYGKFTEIEVEKGVIKEKRYLSDFNIEHLLNILQNGSDSL